MGGNEVQDGEPEEEMKSEDDIKKNAGRDAGGTKTKVEIWKSLRGPIMTRAIRLEIYASLVPKTRMARS